MQLVDSVERERADVGGPSLEDSGFVTVLVASVEGGWADVDGSLQAEDFGFVAATLASVVGGRAILLFLFCFCHQLVPIFVF